MTPDNNIVRNTNTFIALINITADIQSIDTQACTELLGCFYPRLPTT